VGLDGERRCVVTQSVPIIYRGRPAAQTVVRDVTERRRREEQLQEARDEAQQMNRLKSAFLANMSHEIRTPLTAIIGFAELLGDEDRTNEEEISELIVDSSQRLLRTLNSVLDLSRLESGSMHLSPDRFDFVELVRDAARLFQREAQKQSVALDVTLPDAPCAVWLDPSAVDRILSNLIGNAIKFTSDGGSVDVGLTCESDHIQLSVSDTGIGIDADFLPRVFEAFHQESTGTARSHEGTGLGLAITRRLTELMNGTIAVESTKQVGTTFIVTLPRVLDR
jgi:signal transduction histidine kinase